MRKSITSVITLTLTATLLTGCSGIESGNPGNKGNPVEWPALVSAVPRDPAIEQRIDELLAQMTTEQKVGQLIQPELRNITPEQIRQYHIGSLLNGGGSFPNDDKYASVEDWLALADSFYKASMDTSGGGIAIPIMWGTDAVHGHNNVIGATLFPHNIGLGAANNPELIRAINAATAREVAVTGIDWNFSPTLAVARDDRWGRTYEAYAEDPALVKAYGGKAVEGLQGTAGTDTFMAADRVIATAKHFIGDGATLDGVDRGDAAISERELRDIHTPGYFSAIEAGVQTIMASFNSWQGEKLHGHRYLLTEVLKEQMGFDGLVVGDWNGHEFVDGCTRGSCAQAFNAGVDIFMVPDDWQALYTNTLAQVNRGEISRERLDDAVRRILRVKLRAGLFEKGLPSQRPYSGRTELLGAAEHRAIARQAVRESLVLLKNSNDLLPLARSSRVLVAGDGAHNIGKQSGGWTLTWQGTGNTNDDFPGATSIYQGIAEIVRAAGGTVQLSEEGRYTDKPDVAIVVFGEDPYAEMQGDISHLAYGSEQDLELLRRLRNEGIPVVAVFLTGRPLWVNPHLNASDAFVVAWLPGSEGGGVADVIFRNDQGGINHDFKGRLSFSWPATAVQSPLNHGQSDYAPLFAYGYGLSYADRDQLGDKLSEVSGVTAAEGSQQLNIFRDRALEPWELAIADGSRRHLPVTGSSASLPGIRVQSVDRFVQEDSRRVSWTGVDEARVSLSAGQRTDLTPYLEQQGALVFDVRVEGAPNAPVRLGMSCGQDCGGEVEVTELLRGVSAGQWHTLSVSLKCLSGAGVDMGMVLVPFYLQSAGALDLTLHHLRIAPEPSAQLRCD
jgi:beta-glucosidase